MVEGSRKRAKTALWTKFASWRPGFLWSWFIHLSAGSFSKQLVSSLVTLIAFPPNTHLHLVGAPGPSDVRVDHHGPPVHD